MCKTFLFILLINFFINLNAKGQQRYFFSLDHNVHSIWVANIKGTEYFTFDSPSKNLKSSNSTELYEYKFGKNSFSFLPGSQFFRLEDKYGHHHHFQLHRPVIIIDGKLFVPLRSFLDCLVNSNLFQISFAPKSYAFVFLENQKVFALPKTSKETKVIVENEAKKSSNSNQYQILQDSEESKKFPRLVLTNNERFLSTNGNQIKLQGKGYNKELENQGNKNKDTTGKIPPKYYVLPPELKNNPK